MGHQHFKGIAGGGGGADRVKRTFLILCLILACYVSNVQSGCRVQEDKCPPVCGYNALTNELECNLRAVLIFTNSTEFEASLEKVREDLMGRRKREDNQELFPLDGNCLGLFDGENLCHEIAAGEFEN